MSKSIQITNAQPAELETQAAPTYKLVVDMDKMRVRDMVQLEEMARNNERTTRDMVKLLAGFIHNADGKRVPVEHATEWLMEQERSTFADLVSRLFDAIKDFSDNTPKKTTVN